MIVVDGIFCDESHQMMMMTTRMRTSGVDCHALASEATLVVILYCYNSTTNADVDVCAKAFDLVFLSLNEKNRGFQE